MYPLKRDALSRWIQISIIRKRVFYDGWWPEQMSGERWPKVGLWGIGWTNDVQIGTLLVSKTTIS